MRKFILKIIVSLLPILIFGLVIEFALRSVPNDYSYKKEYLDTHSNDLETLILGSSHSYYDINPIYFQNDCFNASNISQSFDYDLEILKKYEDSIAKLKTVILPISYMSLFDMLKVDGLPWRTKNYVIYWGFKKANSLFDYSEILSHRFDINLKKLSSFYMDGITSITCSEFGWGKSFYEVNPESLEKSGNRAAIRHTKDYTYYEENILILNSIIELCRKHNVKVILFTPPAYVTYRNYLNKDQLKNTLKIAKEVANNFDNCSYINLLDDPNFKATDYYDADHLNGSGAKKLSILLNTFIKDKEGL